MSLHQKLLQLEETGKPIRIGMVGAGKFGSMFLAQVRKLPGVQVGGSPTCPSKGRARILHRLACRIARRWLGRGAARTGGIFPTEDAMALAASRSST